MEFPFNEKKAAQAAAYLLWQHGGEHDYGCLIKLLYLADRKALVETGLPITGDEMWALDHGPILSRVKNCLTGERAYAEIWGKYVSQRDEGNRVKLTHQRPETDELSDYEIEVLEEIDQEHGAKSWAELRRFTHDSLPEYEEPAASSSQRIHPEKVLIAAGVPRQKILEFTAQADEIMRAVAAGGSGL